jgi:single-strand DNA-binding protein
MFFGYLGLIIIYKGSKILIEGRLILNQWTDQNGQKRSKHSVAVDSMQMLDKKSDNTDDTKEYPF